VNSGFEDGHGHPHIGPLHPGAIVDVTALLPQVRIVDCWRFSYAGSSNPRIPHRMGNSIQHGLTWCIKLIQDPVMKNLSGYTLAEVEPLMWSLNRMLAHRETQFGQLDNVFKKYSHE
jgi:hypothetical protein